MSRILYILRCEWVASLVEKIWTKLENSGKIGKFLVTIFVFLGLAMIGAGLLVIFGLIYGLGTTYSFSLMFIIGGLFGLLSYHCIKTNQPWFWTILFILGTWFFFVALN